MRQEACWLSGHCGPGFAAIGTPIDAVAQVSYANVNRLRGAVGAQRMRIECDPDHADQVSRVRAGRIWKICSGIGEASDLGPRLTRIGASPQTVSATRSKVKNAVVIWINRQPLTHVAARHVPADFERQIE